MTDRPTIFLGVGAGVATFKAVALASQLAQHGFVVRVAMTAAAQSYVGPLSFRAVTGQEVIIGYTNGYNDGDFLVNDLGIPTVNYGPGESPRRATGHQVVRS